MVTAVATSTTSTATAAFNGRHLDRCQDGTLWATFTASGVSDGAASTSTGSVLAYSKDSGATWNSLGVDGGSGGGAIYGAANASLFIDVDDFAHLVFKAVGTAPSGSVGGARTVHYVYYMRGTPNVGRTAWTWSTAVTITSAPNQDYPDVVAHREGTGWAVHAVHSNTNTSGENYANYARLSITSGGVISTALASTFIGGSYGAGVNVHTYPSIDFHHTGDGKTVAGGTPHLYVGWTAGATGAGKGVRFRKAVYSGGAWTWNAEREIDSTRGAATTGVWLNTVFDGTRISLAGLTFGTFVHVMLYERDAADTTTTTRLLLGTGSSDASVTDYLVHGSAAYDAAGNIYLFGRDSAGANGSRKLNLRKWTRATATLGAIQTIEASGNDAPYISARRGNQPGNSIDVVYTDGTSSPYTVQYDRLALNVAPGSPGAFTSPTSGQNVDASANVAWGSATDADGETPTYDLDYTRDNGASWTSLFTNRSGVTYVHDVSQVTSSTAARYRVRARDAAGLVSSWTESQNFTVQHNQPPNPADQLSPAGNASVSRTVDQDLVWRFNDPDAGDTQSAYELRYRLVGAGTWTSTGKIQSTQSKHRFLANSLAAGNYEWQVLTYDSIGVTATGWSQSAFFTAATPPPGPTITKPVNNATAQQNDVVEWSYPSQSRYRVRRLADAAGAPADPAVPANVYSDTGWVSSSTARNAALAFATNNRTEHVQVAITDSATGLDSPYSSSKVSVSYTLPPTPVIAVAPDNGSGHVGVQITNPAPTGTEPAVINNEIWRDGVRIAKNISPNGTYLDYGAVHGRSHSYSVVAIGANGTQRESVVSTAILSLVGMWIHDPKSPYLTAINLPYDGMGKKSEKVLDLTLRRFAGKAAPTPEWGVGVGRSIAVTTAFTREEAVLRDALEALMDRRTVLCLRDVRGRKMYGVFSSFPLSDVEWGQKIEISFTEVHYTEAV